MWGSQHRLSGFKYANVHGHACPRLELSRLVVIDDARLVCARDQWQQLPPARWPHAPIWEVRTSHVKELNLSPIWSARCEPPNSQCAAVDVERPSQRFGRQYCVLSIHNAVVLESGLTVNSTHRFNLAPSHGLIERVWKRDGFGINGDARVASLCEVFKIRYRPLVYSFRQQYSHNPWHTLVQVLPLLPPVLEQIKTDPRATLLVTSTLFKVLANHWLPPEKILFTAAPVMANEVRLVVGRPPFSPLGHEFAFGCISALRPPLPKVPPTTLLFLARQPLETKASTSARAWHATAARAFDERPVLQRTREVLNRQGSSLQLVPFEFTTLTEQQRAFSTARVIVGAHGTGWSGLAFAPPDVIIIEWAFLRDSWTIAEYLGLNASYFQLTPHWIDHPGIFPCNNSHLMDDCPWYLDVTDLDTYATLLEQVVHALDRHDTSSVAMVIGKSPPLGRSVGKHSVRSEDECKRGVRTARRSFDPVTI